MPNDTELAQLKREETLLTALDTALEMAETLLSTGHLLSEYGISKFKRDIETLQEYAASLREKEAGK